MKFSALIITLFLTQLSFAQPDPQQTIEQFFEAFQLRDSNAIKPFFDSEISQMATIFRNKEGKLIVRYGNLQDFITAIGTPDGKKWEEKASNFKVQTTDGLAQVWCDYSFYLDDKLHHCGVDAFQLVWLDNRWKITYLADTRTPECTE